MSQRITWWRSSFLPSQNWTQILIPIIINSPFGEILDQPKGTGGLQTWLFFRCTIPKINMTIGKTPSFIGDTASNGHFSIVMLVFEGISIGLVLLPRMPVRGSQTTHLPRWHRKGMNPKYLCVFVKFQGVHPRKLTCPLKRDYFNREYIFQPLIFKGHVSFPWSITKKIFQVSFSWLCLFAWLFVCLVSAQPLAGSSCAPDFL